MRFIKCDECNEEVAYANNFGSIGQPSYAYMLDTNIAIRVDFLFRKGLEANYINDLCPKCTINFLKGLIQALQEDFGVEE